VLVPALRKDNQNVLFGPILVADFDVNEYYVYTIIGEEF